jgi:hypothetical protein
MIDVLPVQRRLRVVAGAQRRRTRGGKILGAHLRPLALLAYVVFGVEFALSQS